MLKQLLFPDLRTVVSQVVSTHVSTSHALLTRLPRQLCPPHAASRSRKTPRHRCPHSTQSKWPRLETGGRAQRNWRHRQTCARRRSVEANCQRERRQVCSSAHSKVPTGANCESDRCRTTQEPRPVERHPSRRSTVDADADDDASPTPAYIDARPPCAF
jgi:hypothetical protein